MFVFARTDMPWRKMAGAALAVVLHAVIATLFPRAILAPMRVAAPARKVIFYLRPLPQPRAKADPRERPNRKSAPDIAIPFESSTTLPQTPDAKALEGLGRELFDCRPENLSALPAEQRARCDSRRLMPDNSVDFADHASRVRNAARWAREKQRKNGPALLPCASNQSIFATMSTATLLCLLNGAIDGFDPESAPIYGERPEEFHLPNNGDPPPTYTDPDH
jgi:hypothetical protein